MPPKKLSPEDLEREFEKWKNVEAPDQQYAKLLKLNKALANSKDFGPNKDCSADMLEDIWTDWEEVLVALTEVVDAFKVPRKTKGIRKYFRRGHRLQLMSSVTCEPCSSRRLTRTQC